LQKNITTAAQINNRNNNCTILSSLSFLFFLFSSFCFFFSCSWTRLATSSKLTPLITLLALAFFLFFGFSRLPGVCFPLGFNGIGAGVELRLLLDRDFGVDTLELSKLEEISSCESSCLLSSITIWSGYLFFFFFFFFFF